MSLSACLSTMDLLSLASSSQAFLSSPSFKPASLPCPPKIKPHSRFPCRRRRMHAPAALADSHSSSPNSSAADLSPDHHQLSSDVDRRQLLLGSASLGIAGLPALLLPHDGLSAPLQPPDLTKCSPVQIPKPLPNNVSSVNCCVPPYASGPVPFTLPTNQRLRTRIPAQEASATYIGQYRRAYELLRQLPANDPRQFTQQANVHCAYCAEAYKQLGTDIVYQVHFSWLFFAWHRWYLYFHERILASLLKDDTFALPFWNWDAVSGSTIPAMFTDRQSSLYNANRNPAHQPPAVVDLNYAFRDPNEKLTPAQQLSQNNALMYTQVVSGATTPELFFGRAVVQGDPTDLNLDTGGTVERAPHITVHAWTGNPAPATPNNEDMGILYSAARDPIFFAHHANIDRLWEVWKTLGGRRQDISQPDYLNTTFLFYDENARLVSVRVGDGLNPASLAYRYQDVQNTWINPPATSLRTTATAAKFREKLKESKAGLKEYKDRASKTVENPVTVLVKRPKKVLASDFEEEVLVLQEVVIPADENVKFDVFVNLPPDDDDYGKVGCTTPEFAGPFYNLPHAGHGGMKLSRTDFRVAIGQLLKRLDAEDDDDLTVTIVPRVKPSIPISIGNVKIVYE